MAGLACRDRARGRIAWVYANLIAFNALVWALALLAFRGQPLMLGSAVLAYAFGLRHAVDADHIAAIDNVTRKLMRDGQRPVGVGLFFALGHSTVVILAFIALAVTASAMEGRFRALKALGSVIGTSVSVTFLFLIAFANVLVLIGVHRAFQRVRRGGPFVEEDLDILLANRGLISRLARPALALIGRSWHMYPLGLLFGLGFDTATEIAILGLSAQGATHGAHLGAPPLPPLIFPLLFTAGMTLIDTTDSILMLGAYGWAFVKPIRKLYYNMTITLVSVIIAVAIGVIETLGLIGARLNGAFGALGYGIIGVFVGAWLVSALIYRIKGYDRIDVPGA